MTTHIHITFDDAGDATLLVQRGDLASVRLFAYDVDTLADELRVSFDALGALEANPPSEPLSDEPKAERKPKKAPKVASDDEPTIEIPTKKGAVSVKISLLKIGAGETDAGAYRQAMAIAGRLYDGKLWDGESPLRLGDVYDAGRKLKHLTDKDLALFSLADFTVEG